MNNVAVIVLIVFSLAGFAMGLLYYFKPEKTVMRRIKDEHQELAANDPEFRHWLELEIESQTNRTKKIGLFMIIMELIWVVVILVLWQGNYIKFK